MIKAFILFIKMYLIILNNRFMIIRILTHYYLNNLYY